MICAQYSECQRGENFKDARVNGRCNQNSHKRLPNVLISAVHVKVSEIQTRVNDGSGHDALGVTSSECQSDGNSHERRRDR